MTDYTDNEPPVTYEQVWDEMAKREQAVYRRDLFTAFALAGLANCPEFEAIRSAEDTSNEYRRARLELAFRAADLGNATEDVATYGDEAFDARVGKEVEYRKAVARKRAKLTAKND